MNAIYTKKATLTGALMLALGLNVSWQHISFNPNSSGETTYASQTPAAQDKELILSCGKFAADYFQTGSDVVVHLEAIDGKPCEGRCGTKVFKETKISNLDEIRKTLAAQCESYAKPAPAPAPAVAEKAPATKFEDLTIAAKIESLEKSCKDKSSSDRLQCHVDNLGTASEKLASAMDKDQKEVVTKYFQKHIRGPLSKLISSLNGADSEEDDIDTAKEMIATLTALDYNNGKDVQKQISSLTLNKYKAALYRSSLEHLQINTAKYENPWDQKRDLELAAAGTYRVNSMFSDLGNTYLDGVKETLQNMEDEKQMRKAMRDLNLEWFRNQMSLTKNAFSPYITRENQISSSLLNGGGEFGEMKLLTPEIFQQRSAGRTNGVVLPSGSIGSRPATGYTPSLNGRVGRISQ